MEIFHALVLGVVEGITEFLPISSTGHLIIVSKWLGIDQSSVHIAFEVIIQLAAIMAVGANYSQKFRPRYFTLWVKVFIAFLPLALIGFIFKDQIKLLFLNAYIVPIMFIIGGVIFLILEFFHKDRHVNTGCIDDINYTQACWVGFAQIFALVPGTSRAGSTIVGAMLVGLSRKASAEFSFLLALPVMGAVSAYELLKNYHEFSDANWTALVIGFIVSFVAAWLTLKLFIKFLESYTFVAFGIYRILFGILLLAILN